METLLNVFPLCLSSIFSNLFSIEKKMAISHVMLHKIKLCPKNSAKIHKFLCLALVICLCGKHKKIKGHYLTH